MELRPARPEDLRACAAVTSEALADLARREGRAPLAPAADDVLPVILHGYQRAPEGFHVALDDGGAVSAFSGAWPRDGLWWLGFLFARPDRQRAGVGRELLSRALAPGEGAPNVFTFASSDPPANALYMRHGMMPRAAVLSFSLDTERGEAKLALEPLRRSTMAFERERFGYARGHDHKFFLEQGAGFELVRPDGARVGFGYLGNDGRVGPVACAAASDVWDALDALVAEAAARGLPRATLRVPHANAGALRWCAARRARFEGTNLLMAAAPLAPMDLVVLGNPGLA